MSENLARACGTNSLQPCPTAQSSTHEGFGSWKANDGNTNGNWYGQSCTCTAISSSNPWWRVDLGKTRTVTSVKLWNRADCCADRLQGFEVWIGDDASYSANSRCLTGGAALLTSPYDILVDCIGTGRYLFVVLPGNNRILTLCEVEVYGGECS